MGSEPEEARMSALSQSPELDSLLERPFEAGETSDIRSFHNDRQASENAQFDSSSSSYERLSSQQTEAESEPRAVSPWIPFWSSPALLITLSAILALLSGATIALWRVSVGKHGFPLLTTSNYSWTYGPTAVLTVIMSIWSQTTYFCKLLEPWRELKKGPASPERTVLLDYISPILPVNLGKATRLKHTTVLISIYSGLVLRVVTVASTGLLNPVSMSMPFQNVTLEALTTFNFSSNELVGSDIDSLAESAIDYEAYALIANNLTFPDGIQPNLAFQRFRLSNDSTANGTLSTVRGTVQAFRPLIQCEEANVVPLNASTSLSENVGNAGNAGNVGMLEVFANASWKSCSSSQAHPYQVDVTYQCLPHISPTRQLFGWIAYPDYTCRDAEESFWSSVMLFDVQYNQTAIPSAIIRAEPLNSSDIWGV